MQLPNIPDVNELLGKLTPVAYPHPMRGVYFLFKEGQLIYVGKTPNLYRRLGEHQAKRFDAYAFMPLGSEYSDEDVGLYERRCIDALKPPLNQIVPHHEGMPLPARKDRTTIAVKRGIARVCGGETIYTAAKKEKVSYSALYNAIKRHRAKNG